MVLPTNGVGRAASGGIVGVKDVCAAERAKVTRERMTMDQENIGIENIGIVMELEDEN